MHTMLWQNIWQMHITTDCTSCCVRAVACLNLQAAALATVIPNTASGNFDTVPRPRTDFNTGARVSDLVWRSNCGTAVDKGKECSADALITGVFILLPSNVSRTVSVTTCGFSAGNDTMLAVVRAIKDATSKMSG